MNSIHTPRSPDYYDRLFKELEKLRLESKRTGRPIFTSSQKSQGIDWRCVRAEMDIPTEIGTMAIYYKVVDTGVTLFRCRGHGLTYYNFYEWLKQQSFVTDWSDFPWHGFHFFDKSIAHELLSKYSEFCYEEAENDPQKTSV